MSRDDIERAVLVNEQQHDLMSAAETSGVIMHRTADGVWTELGTVGAMWTAVGPSGPWTRTAIGSADPETFLVDDSGSWWVSDDGGTIDRSDDRGQAWTTVYEPPST